MRRSWRALEIPAVVGLGDIGQIVKSGDTVLLDGTRGRVVINPSPEEKIQYGNLLHVRDGLRKHLQGHKDELAETRDGKRIGIHANIDLVDHVSRVQDSGAEGIGLFRTEYLFLSRPDLPSEDEQVAVYEAIAQAMAPAPVVIRTLNAGGEKMLSHQHLQEQSASPLGCCGIRLSLARPDIFKVQLRAILRAGAGGNLRLMYPMVSGPEELRQANAVLHQAVEELRMEGCAFQENPEIGAMIEIPSAALTVDLIAAEVSFLSMGTNDLVQYTIAVDRLDRNCASLYEPTHPGVLRIIKQAVDLAQKSGTRMTVCGEMAGSPLLAPLLIGLGIEALSMAPGSIPIVKHVIRSIRHANAVSLANEALNGRCADAVMAACRKLVERDAHDIKELLA